MQNIRTHTRFAYFSYAVLAIPIAFASLPLYVYAPDYYASHFNLSLTQLAYALLAIRLFDSFQDPILGYLSDKFSSQRAKWLLIASILLALGFFGLFKPLPLNALLQFTLMMAIVSTAYSFLSINLYALGCLWTPKPQQSLRASHYRETCTTLGLLAAIVLPSFLQTSVSVSQSFFYVSIVLAICLALAYPIFSNWLRHAKLTSVNLSLSPLLQALGEAKRLRHCFFILYSLNFFALSIPMVLIIFYVRDYLHAQSFIGLFLALYFIAALVGMGLCRILAKRYSPLSLWRLSMLMGCVSFIWVLFLQPGQTTHFALICIASGLCFAADLLFPPSILTALLHHKRAQHHSGINFSLYSFIAKTCLALASLCTLWLLGNAGFVPGANNNNSALLVLRILYALVPCTIKLVTALLLPCLISGEKYDPTHVSDPSREHHHA